MTPRNTGPPPPSSSAKTAVIPIHLQPGASRGRLGEKTDRGWKLAVTAPAVEGRANRACVEFLAKTLGVRARRFASRKARQAAKSLSPSKAFPSIKRKPDWPMPVVPPAPSKPFQPTNPLDLIATA